MRILVFNCGSSSLNYKLYNVSSNGALRVVWHGKAHRIGVIGSVPAYIEHHHGAESSREERPIHDHRQAAGLALERLAAEGEVVDAIGHRFVHGGDAFHSTILITADARERLQATLPLAPIHNPNSLSVIEACDAALPGVPQYLTFDTAFHSGMPPSASAYALPHDLVTRYGLRRYGFHGLSYQYVTRAVARFLDLPLESLRMVACHLGTGGSSVAAIQGGRSLDTSMGFSPLAGLVMSTRTGDIDPILPLYLERELGTTPGELETLFNKRSGLLGLSGFSSDIRDIEKRAAGGDERARLALDVYIHRLRKSIGAFAAVLGGLDVLIFTDDVGAGDAHVRAAACAGLEWCGVTLDEQANRHAPADHPALISTAGSRVRVVSLPTDEERVIAEEGWRLLGEVNHAIA